MTWLGWLMIVVIVAAFAAVTGIKPRGSRPVAGTSLMSAARIVLFVLALLVAYMFFRQG